MKRPTSTHTDSSAGPEWYRYWDAIGDAASTGHGLEVTWDGGIVYVEINETRGGDILTFHPCRPQWVACWTIHPVDDEAGTSIIADGDPRLLPIADGPALGGNADEVGEWIATVIVTIAGHRPGGGSVRDFVADGYTTFPGA
jgi:hypothetical protein